MKVFFNNSCKICKTEIDLYKKENVSEIEWIDISKNKEAQKETNKNGKELLRRLHIKIDNQTIGGAKAFLHLWKKIPKYRLLYKILKTPIIFSIFNIMYEIVAYFLYLKNRKQLKD